MKKIILVTVFCFLTVGTACFGQVPVEASKDVTLAAYAKERKLNETYLRMGLVQDGCELNLAVGLLGEPTSQQISEVLGVSMIDCEWSFGKEKSLHATFRNSKAIVLKPKGFTVSEYETYRKAADDFLNKFNKEVENLKEQEQFKRRLTEQEKWEAHVKERTEKYLAEAKEVREWKTMAGRVYKGLLVGVDKDFVLIKDPDAPEDKKPSRVEAFRLELRDRGIIEAYCDKNKLPVPELNPADKIKKGMTRQIVESILGRSDHDDLNISTWEFGDKYMGFQKFNIWFDRKDKTKPITTDIYYYEKGIRTRQFLHPAPSPDWPNEQFRDPWPFLYPESSSDVNRTDQQFVDPLP